MLGADPFFYPTLWRVLAVFGAGLLLTLVLARFNLRRIVEGELGARVIGWLVLVPIYIVALFTSSAVGVPLLVTAMLILLWEYGEAASLNTLETAFLWATALGTVAIVITVPVLFYPLPVLLLFALTLLPILGNDPDLLDSRVRVLSWGHTYTVWTLGHVVLMLALPQGKMVLVTLLLGCALADVGAYTVGKAIGRTVIAPSVNLHKAWEGLLGDLIGAAIAVALFRFGLPPLGLPALVGLVLIIGLGSSWGDILSSLAKRRAGIKDWGSVVPGHGGLLDRLNSFLVVLPLTYYYLALVLGQTL